ncbi:hypothetical protein FHS54_002883 [Sphingobium vermicomposti]|uniref:Uncharacterized protein n=1 Tax=Sphingobium vermicomposti TaxID=529005 RepID=A0A846M8V5_9SPHN|nr:hypothetical protein [Sphingobium vermicomposti]
MISTKRRLGGEEKQAGIILPQCGIAGAEGRGELYFVPDPQIWHTQNGGEIAVQPCGFELVFSAQYFERGRLQYVDDLAFAMDFDDMDNRRTSGRVPGQRQVAKLQRIGMEDLDAVTIIEQVPLAIQMNLRVLTADKDSPCGIARYRHRLRLDGPFGCRPGLDLASGCISGGSGKQARQANRNLETHNTP